MERGWCLRQNWDVWGGFIGLFRTLSAQRCRALAALCNFSGRPTVISCPWTLLATYTPRPAGTRLLPCLFPVPDPGTFPSSLSPFHADFSPYLPCASLVTPSWLYLNQLTWLPECPQSPSNQPGSPVTLLCFQNQKFSSESIKLFEDLARHWPLRYQQVYSLNITTFSFNVLPTVLRELSLVLTILIYEKEKQGVDHVKYPMTKKFF